MYSFQGAKVRFFFEIYKFGAIKFGSVHELTLQLKQNADSLVSAKIIAKLYSNGE